MTALPEFENCRDWSNMSDEYEVIDVDDLDVFCTGVRHCIRIDRPPSPLRKKRARHSPTDQSPSTELQRITQLELESRKALHDLHPAKRRATDALRMAINVVESHTHLKRKEAPEVIEISSDSEPEYWPPKRQKVEERAELSHILAGSPARTSKFEDEASPAPFRSPSPSESCDSDTDDDHCINFLASLDISNEANWIPIPDRNKAEDLTPILELNDEPPKPNPLSPFRLPRRKPPVDYRHVPIDWFSKGPWGMLSKSVGITKFPKPFWRAHREDCLFPRHPPNLYYENGYTKFELTAKYPHLASGSVNKVIQSHGTVVLGAVVEGGIEDDDDDDDEDCPPPPPDNKPGSLIVYHQGRVHVAPAHRRPRNTSRGLVMKHYTVHDVVFNPHNPRQFLSSGHDLVVQAWEISNNDDNDEHESLTSTREITFDSRPLDLVYNADSSVLAISCFDGTVRAYCHDLDVMDAFPPRKFNTAPRGCGHATGSTLWGKEPSQHLLFTSSEPLAKESYSGFHHAFDVQKGVQALRFDATEAGDATALSPDGTTLALFTRGDGNTHPVRLYDVRRKAEEAYEMEELEKFHVRPITVETRDDSEEVNQSSFSPDGRLLAVARSDNALHVYDVRALSRGPLCQFEHHDSDDVSGARFGVVALHWVQGRSRIGIVSGGNDGCVRLWEPALGGNDVQGSVLGRTDYDVGHFSIGDRQNGEFPLVIGDAGGAMHTYDFTNPDGIPL